MLSKTSVQKNSLVSRITSVSNAGKQTSVLRLSSAPRLLGRMVSWTIVSHGKYQQRLVSHVTWRLIFECRFDVVKDLRSVVKDKYKDLRLEDKDKDLWIGPLWSSKTRTYLEVTTTLVSKHRSDWWTKCSRRYMILHRLLCAVHWHEVSAWRHQFCCG